MSAVVQLYPRMLRCGCVPSEGISCARARYLDNLATDLFTDAREALGEPLYVPLLTNARRTRELHDRHLNGGEPNACYFCERDRGEGYGPHCDLCRTCAGQHYD